MTTEGFLNLNKPAGMTSHDCVGRVRRLLKLKRVGHGGTLDPAVTGVLPIALGKATRLLQFLQQGKAYRGTIRFGLITATDDLEGEILSARSVPELTLETVQAALPNFMGNISQFPPNYSAVQVGGKRLYDLARQGKTVEVAARNVEVFRLEILDWRAGDFPELDLAIACSPATPAPMTMVSPSIERPPTAGKKKVLFVGRVSGGVRVVTSAQVPSARCS